MIQGCCHVLPFTSAGKPYGFFPDDYKEKLCCESSPTGFLQLQASTQHSFFSWSKPSACFTPKAVSVLLRGCFLQLEERQIPLPLSPRPQCNNTKQSTTRSHLCMQELHILSRSFGLLSYHSSASLPVTVQAGFQIQPDLVTGSRQGQPFPCFKPCGFAAPSLY